LIVPDYLKDDMPGVIAGVAATLGAGKEMAAHIQTRRLRLPPPTA